MNHLDRTIARIPSMEAKARAVLRKNADDILTKSPGDPNAQRVLDALKAFEASQPKAARFTVTGLLSWEKYEQGATSSVRAFFGDQIVGRIFKRANHTSLDKEVYSVEVLGRSLPGNWHHIADARAAGEAAFVEQQSQK